MIYLTKDYIIKEFENREQALNFIKEDMDKHNLNYQLVYSHKNKNMEVLIYQYFTLYMETYIIHNDLDLRKRSNLYD